MQNIADRTLRVLLYPKVRYGLAWLLAIVTVGGSLYYAWHSFDDFRRPDRNDGHCQIDFGCQWLMGRMLVEGHGRELYHRGHQRAILQAAYPRESEVPPEERRTEEERSAHDAENLLGWMISHEDSNGLAATVTPLAGADPFQAAVLAACGQEQWEPRRLEKAMAARGGPLYPPIHAFVCYPLALLAPQPAYRVCQVANLVLALVAALGISRLADGRVWWPVAITVIILYPGFKASINLGQNATLSLAILTWGWVLMTRGRPGWGGLVWALLAYKPVWAAAFFLVPFLTRRWRACAAMLAGGVTLALMTLPFVGWRNWLDWLQIGRDAAGMYSTDINWVHVSRDLLNIPRRWFWVPEPADEWRLWWGTVLGWGLWLAVVGSTVCLALLRHRQVRAATGPIEAFLLLGAWMSCYHFMYYEVLLTALPMLLLFTEPRRYLEPILLAVVPFGRTVTQGGPSAYFEPTLPQNYPPPLEVFSVGPRSVAVLNRLAPSLLVLLLAIEHLFPALNVFVTVKAGVPGIGYTTPDGTISTLLSTPWDTYCLLILWLWCGWQWVRERSSQPEAPAREPAALASASG